MTSTQLLRTISLELHETSSTPGLDARLILSLATHIDPDKIYLLDRDLTPAEWEQVNFYIKKRQNQVPIAHLQGYKYFYGLPFYVSSEVLIPRPESEYMVDIAINLCMKETNPPTIIDIGTGSGCLAITIAKNYPQALVYATDISPQVLHIAQKNAIMNLNRQVNVIQSDLLREVEIVPDIIVANLPYLTKQELAHPSLTHEPQIALYSDKKGIGHYLRLFDQIQALHLSTHLIIEINPQQTQRLVDELAYRFSLTYLEIAQDLAGKDRHISCYINANYAERR